MNALTEAINAIKKPLQSLPFDEFGAVREHNLAETIPAWHDLPTPTEILSEWLPEMCGGDGPRLLGSYRPMATTAGPGLITLYVGDLQQFYWSVVREMARRLPGFPFSKQDLEFLVTFIVEKIWHHELFHHSIEVLWILIHNPRIHRDPQKKGILRGRFCRYLLMDIPLEEALAVAYARQCLCRSAMNSNAGRMGKVLFNLAMQIAFDGYAPSGFPDWTNYTPSAYSDWPKFDSTEMFNGGIAELLQLPQRQFLESSGVPVGDLLVRLIPVLQGFNERIQ